jgi:hypothetical protein
VGAFSLSGGTGRVFDLTADDAQAGRAGCFEPEPGLSRPTDGSLNGPQEPVAMLWKAPHAAMAQRLKVAGRLTSSDQDAAGTTDQGFGSPVDPDRLEDGVPGIATPMNWLLSSFDSQIADILI